MKAYIRINKEKKKKHVNKGDETAADASGKEL